MAPPVVAIFGPTASGKTALAVAVADRLDGEVVSADSMQIYRGLEGLTNQPDEAERRGVPHHLIGIVDPDESYDVVRYGAEARAAIDDILERGRTAIVAGGTGLYLRAALSDLDPPPAPTPAQRERISAEVAAEGTKAAHARLAKLDPAAAARIDPNDARRIVRALELHELGRSLAPAGGDALWATTYRHPTRTVALRVPRAELHARVAQRTPALLERGIPEVETLRNHPRGLSATARQAHGVADIEQLLDGDIDRATCLRRLEARTRQYQKRQETWARRLADARSIDGMQALTAQVEEAVRLAR